MIKINNIFYQGNHTYWGRRGGKKVRNRVPRFLTFCNSAAYTSMFSGLGALGAEMMGLKIVWTSRPTDLLGLAK